MSEANRKVQIMRPKEVCEKLGVSPSTLYRLEAEGGFPKRISLGSRRSVGFVEFEIDEWIEQQIAARDAGESYGDS